ncbi:MAG TPA: regulatory protein RecX [Gaiellaceae bacterium]|nr:regulatory protein RecX [Gaiellaceae bacterium]
MPGTDAFAAVVDALARRDLTAAELAQRLTRAGFEADACADGLARAAAAGYLDDERVALERSRRLAERGASDEAIRVELERRGLAEQLVEAALAAIEPEQERAERLANKLGGGARAARALLRKGYPEDIVERIAGGPIAE